MRFILIAIIVVLLSPATVPAQSDMCPAVVEAALAATTQGCAAVGPGEVCFGHGDMEAVVNCETPPDFDSPGDTMSLEPVCSLRLGGLQSSGQWGVAKMQVVATGSDDGITYIPFGDVEIQNAASARSELRVWVRADTEVHGGPGSQYEIMGTLHAGRIIHANACNCTGNWLRTVLDDGRVGWLLARHVSVLGDANTLPTVTMDTPVYASMQAFTFRSGSQPPACAEAPADGILIQAPVGSAAASLQINGVAVTFDSTLFVQSQPGASLSVTVLDGYARVTAMDFTALVPAGARAAVPMSMGNTPNGEMRVEPYTREDIATLPIGLLPAAVDPMAALAEDTPSIVGVETCSVLSDTGETICPLHFLNPDGDPITRMDVEFVYAPQGEWTGSTVEAPELLDGDNVSGRLAWRVSCSLGSANFIGPIRWSLAISDAAGHLSPPFEASFNCIDG
jgi:hypothetical protein